MARTSVAANSEREVQLVEMLHESKGSLQHASDLFRQLSALFQAIQKCGGETQELAALGRAARPSVCPMPSPPPANVMRPPSAEQSLRALLFESGETPTTNSRPAKP